jgi:hypothetical protein
VASWRRIVGPEVTIDPVAAEEVAADVAPVTAQIVDH